MGGGGETEDGTIYIYIQYMWRTKLFTNCNGHGQSGWSLIGCEGVYFHAMCKNRVSVTGRSPIRCEGVHTNLNIPSPLLTTLIVR